MIELNRFYNCDCMELMAQIPDKYFELAIVVPPYGGGATDQHNSDTELCGGGVQTGNIKSDHVSAGGLTSTISATRTGGTWATKYQKVNHAYGGRFAKYQKTTGGIFDADIRHWDIAPPPEYFKELARVSKNQIIWGGNYFDLPPTRCFLVWRKKQIPLEGFSMAPVEYAWTSFNDNARMYECFSSGGSGREERFHPTQKPVELYEWILGKFAKMGDKILDTHVGSASSLIACHNMEFDYVGCEIDEEYYKMASERLEASKMQLRLF